jgi:type II secretory pathway pseudopilin PulG
VKRSPQSGITLLETAVAAGILAVAIAGVLFALTAFSKFIAQQAGVARMAALTLAQQTLRVAQNAWKYGSPGTAPSGSQAAVLPLSLSTTAPATLTSSVTMSGTSAQMTVTVRYTPEPNRPGDSGVVSVTGDLVQKAPLPGSQVSRPGLIPMPSGAP